ncbi:hypothetical protein PAXRUDRAFT_824876 [Paxillus rubicundulus Ve08.2h10]|uniref:Unplaced genomic scaffold scaffold_111, whole genome shotgun sequence n=1 Tax=Paxillus rubicundulus Ve08.2h10 TaxID=930991 RepID=A0A0D0E191_9AGAM|nr:hypothetical protein PAXRUDRAFT_824876 [Paxillus rubicundulus Ve08.2h10]
MGKLSHLPRSCTIEKVQIRHHDNEDENTWEWSVRFVKRQRVRGILSAVTILQLFAVDPWMTVTKMGMSPKSRLR